MRLTKQPVPGLYTMMAPDLVDHQEALNDLVRANLEELRPYPDFGQALRSYLECFSPQFPPGGTEGEGFAYFCWRRNSFPLTATSEAS